MILNFAQVRPWWLRLALLIAIGNPLVKGGSLHAQIHEGHAYQDLVQWVAYALFIWLFILICVGLDRLLRWLSTATLFGLTVALTGAALRKTQIWELIERMATWFTGTAPTPIAQAELDLVFRLLMIMISLPFFLFALTSFPAENLLKWVSSRSATRRLLLVVKLALSLRIFQHVLEVVTTSLVAWKEENPELLLPRFRDDWRGTFLGRLKFFDWARIAVWTWCISLTLQTLLIVPVVVRDFKRLVVER